jgi:type IV pilus biogenesis protein CpaD/CtpE
MKKLLLICAIALLPGCALVDSYLMKYDTNEYRIISEIRADAQGYKTACANELMSTTNAVAIADKTRLFVVFSEYQPHNQPVIKASIELDKIAQGLKTQYASGNKVSPVFCKIKFESIEHSAETMQKIIGAKPK